MPINVGEPTRRTFIPSLSTTDRNFNDAFKKVGDTSLATIVDPDEPGRVFTQFL
jgi:hypothetical protein